MKKILQTLIFLLLFSKCNLSYAQIFVPEGRFYFNRDVSYYLDENSYKTLNVYDPLRILEQITENLGTELNSHKTIEGGVNNYIRIYQKKFSSDYTLLLYKKDTTLDYRINRFKIFLNDYQRVFLEFEEILKNKKSQFKYSEIENINSSLYLAKGIILGMKKIIEETPDCIMHIVGGGEISLGCSYLLIDKNELEKDPYLVNFSTFSEDAAYVKWRGKYGYINSNFELIIDYQYDDANLFNSGKAIVSKSGKSYLIDKNNKGEVCDNLNGKPIYSWKATDGVTVVKHDIEGYEDEYFLLDNFCKIISAKYDKIEEFTENLLLVTLKAKKGIIDKKGKVFMEPIYDNIKSEGDFIIYETKDNKKGILGNTKGDRFSKKDSTYDWIFGYEEKFLLLEKNEKLTLIDLKQRKKLPFVIDDIEPFNKYGLAAFMKDGLWGLLNRDFKVILKPDYKSIDSFNEKGFAILNNKDNYKKDNIVSVIDTKGKILSFRKYSKIDDFHYDYAKVYFYNKKQEKELVGLVDSTWREIIPPVNEKLGQPQYDLIVGTRQDSTSSVFKEYPTVACNDVVYDIKLKKEVLAFQHIFRKDYGAKYDLERSILFDQRLLFIPAAEDEYSFASGEKKQYFVFDIKKRSKINTTIKINSVNSTAKKDFFLVKDIEGKYGLISITDKERVILPCAYDSIYFKSNYYVVSKSYYGGVHKFGIVDSLNNILVPIEFDLIKKVKNNCFIVEKNKVNRKLNGVYNFNSFIVVPILFDDCILGVESIIAKKDNEQFLIDYKGNCLDNCDKFKEILRLE